MGFDLFCIEAKKAAVRVRAKGNAGFLGYGHNIASDSEVCSLVQVACNSSYLIC